MINRSIIDILDSSVAKSESEEGIAILLKRLGVLRDSVRSHHLFLLGLGLILVNDDILLYLSVLKELL